ncbi:unnamed protein product [Blepharisma stoltei]|uniref:NPHP4 Ig-like domain-containing protein n=1 Tax=Blepharisma stoltei TaxID=1481888 RepID=A0AAU9ILY8_9CILI|nr:unnamed protein product [Blepharisma stoltei]
MESGQNDVVIEHCKNCKAHDWCTKHEEAKYTSFYEKTRAEIESQCPEVIVHENYEHPMLRQILEASSKRSPFPKPSFPRMGSFEVYFRGQVISSKLQSGVWPHPGAVASKIREILDGVQQPRQAKTQNDFNPRKNNASPPRAAQATQKPKQAPAKPAQAKQTASRGNEEVRKAEEPKIEQPKKIHSPEYDYNFENDSMPRSPVQQPYEEHEAHPKKEEKHEIIKEQPPHHEEIKHETKPAEAAHEVHQSFHSQNSEVHENVHHEPHNHTELHQTPQEEPHYSEAQSRQDPSYQEESYHEEHKSFHESQHEDPSHQPSYQQTPTNQSYHEAPSQKSFAQEESAHQTPSHYSQSHTGSAQQTPSHHETPAKEQEDPSRSEHYTEEFHESDRGEPEKQSYSGEYEEGSQKGEEAESNHEEHQENPENAEENSYENEAYEAEKQEPITEPPYPLTSNIAADILVGETKQKKISISNDSDEEQQYHIEITNPELIEIKEQDISLPPNGKGKIQLVFKPIDEPCQKTTYLIIQQDGVVKDCYEIKIDYITNS